MGRSDGEKDRGEGKSFRLRERSQRITYGAKRKGEAARKINATKNTAKETIIAHPAVESITCISQNV